MFLSDHVLTNYSLDAGNGFVRTTLAGIAFTGLMKYRAVEYLLPYKEQMSLSNPMDAPFNLFLWQHTLVDGGPSICVPKFSNPLDEMMAGLNEIMFRGGAHFGSIASQTELDPLLDEGVRIENNVTGAVVSPVNVFESNFAYFAGAAVVQLFTIMAILVTFWGWWNLGRDFSFSPLEIGKVRCPKKAFFMLK